MALKHDQSAWCRQAEIVEATTDGISIARGGSARKRRRLKLNEYEHVTTGMRLEVRRSKYDAVG